MSTRPRILPTPAAVIYPEHGTGRTAKLTTCRHCGGKPLIVRRCGNRRTWTKTGTGRRKQAVSNIPVVTLDTINISNYFFR